MSSGASWSSRNRHLVIVARVAVLACVLLYLAGYLVMRAMSQQPDREDLIGPKGKQALSAFYYCCNCRKEFIGTSGNLNPRCPDCLKRTTTTRVKKHCEDCGKDFIAASFDTRTRKWCNVLSKCPVCGGDNLSDIHPEP